MLVGCHGPGLPGDPQMKLLGPQCAVELHVLRIGARCGQLETKFPRTAHAAIQLQGLLSRSRVWQIQAGLQA